MKKDVIAFPPTNRRTALIYAMGPLLLSACGGSSEAPPQSAPPQITQQPNNATVLAGGTAAFSVGADNSSGATYQWLRNGADIAGATRASLDYAAASLLESGASFSVKVSNEAGSAVSRAATLSVTSPALTILAGLETQSSNSNSNSGYVDGVGSNARFGNAGPVAVDDEGNLYVPTSNTIRKVTPGGVVTTFAGARNDFYPLDGDVNTARFLQISELIYDRARRLLVVVDSGSGFGPETLVREVTLAGAVTTVRRTPGRDYDKGAFAPDGTLYGVHGNLRGSLGGLLPSAIYRLPAGAPGQLIAGNPDARGSRDGVGRDALFRDPTALAVDKLGNIYAADFGCLRRIGPDGTVTTLAGSPFVLPAGTAQRNLTLVDGQGSAARFGIVSDLYVESSGNILALDHADVAGSNTAADLNLIRRITPDGLVTSIARSGASDFGGAWSLAFGPTGVPHATGRFWVGRFDAFSA